MRVETFSLHKSSAGLPSCCWATSLHPQLFQRWEGTFCHSWYVCMFTIGAWSAVSSFTTAPPSCTTDPKCEHSLYQYLPRTCPPPQLICERLHVALLHTCTIILRACTSVPLCVPFLLCTEWQPSALFSSRLQCHPVCACHRWWQPLHLDYDLYHCTTQCMLTYCMCGCAYTAHESALLQVAGY